jgi:hypothetical protein
VRSVTGLGVDGVTRARIAGYEGADRDGGVERGGAQELAARLGGRGRSGRGALGPMLSPPRELDGPFEHLTLLTAIGDHQKLDDNRPLVGGRQEGRHPKPAPRPSFIRPPCCTVTAAEARSTTSVGTHRLNENLGNRWPAKRSNRRSARYVPGRAGLQWRQPASGKLVR